MIEADELRRFEFFKEFSEKQLKGLAQIADRISYEADQHIYHRGDPARNLYVVNRGLISLREISSEGEAGRTFEMRERGEIFGAACRMEPQRYTLTAVCMEDSELLVLDAAALSEQCRQDPELERQFMQRIAQIYFERYNRAIQRIQEMTRTPTGALGPKRG